MSPIGTRMTSTYPLGQRTLECQLCWEILHLRVWNESKLVYSTFDVYGERWVDFVLFLMRKVNSVLKEKQKKNEWFGFHTQARMQLVLWHPYHTSLFCLKHFPTNLCMIYKSLSANESWLWWHIFYESTISFDEKWWMVDFNQDFP